MPAAARLFPAAKAKMLGRSKPHTSAPAIRGSLTPRATGRLYRHHDCHHLISRLHSVNLRTDASTGGGQRLVGFFLEVATSNARRLSPHRGNGYRDVSRRPCQFVPAPGGWRHPLSVKGFRPDAVTPSTASTHRRPAPRSPETWMSICSVTLRSCVLCPGQRLVDPYSDSSTSRKTGTTDFPQPGESARWRAATNRPEGIGAGSGAAGDRLRAARLVATTAEGHVTAAWCAAVAGRAPRRSGRGSGRTSRGVAARRWWQRPPVEADGTHRSGLHPGDPDRPGHQLYDRPAGPVEAAQVLRDPGAEQTVARLPDVPQHPVQILTTHRFEVPRPGQVGDTGPTGEGLQHQDAP